jgi:hypothetical protein
MMKGLESRYIANARDKHDVYDLTPDARSETKTGRK